jgi:DNA polymerase
VASINKEERFVGKTTILGCGYGMGAIKFQLQLKNYGVQISKGEAERIISTYRDTYPKITELWKSATKALNAILENKQTTLGRNGVLEVDGKNAILLPNGLYLRYPNLRLQDNEEGQTEVVYDTRRGKQTLANRIYGGKVIENVCQALARIIIGEQMLLIAKKYRVVMTVHDAVACVMPDAEVEHAKEYVELCMRLRPKWALELPLNCEAGYGQSYGDC